MKLFLLAVIPVIALTSCNSTTNSVNSMSNEEIALHNATTASAKDLIFCVNVARTGTRIKRRNCATLLEISSRQSSETLSVLTVHQGSNAFTLFGRSDRQ